MCNGDVFHTQAVVVPGGGGGGGGVLARVCCTSSYVLFYSLFVCLCVCLFVCLSRIGLSVSFAVLTRIHCRHSPPPFAYTWAY
jgi:hypothetical protein